MGVLNVTPDSFSDGGRFFDETKAVEHALAMERDGADILDIGGESTRPGADEVGIDEELSRVIPVIEKLSKRAGLPISIDTRKSKVAEEALKAGASIVNDISGLKFDPQMTPVVSESGSAVILTHSKGDPQTMQLNPVYKNLIGEILEALKEAIAMAKDAGINKDKIIIDPGIGFGKTVEHNLEILRRLDELKVLGRPICVGASRKSFIGKILGIEHSDERLAGTLAASVIAIAKGANIIRVHDVKEMVRASRVADSILRENGYY